MPGSPQKRAKIEQAQADGRLTTPAPTGEALKASDKPPEPKKDKLGRKAAPGASRERMLELVEIRKQKAASGEIKLGRARTRYSNRELTEIHLERLIPKALAVLKEQLNDPDQRVRQAAAVKVLEYRMGKPTQQIKAEVDQRVTAIRFETAALTGVDVYVPPDEDIEEEDASDAS